MASPSKSVGVSPVPSNWRKQNQGTSPAANYDYQLYECAYLLRVRKFESDSTAVAPAIRQWCIQDSGCRVLLVLICDNGSLLLHLKESNEMPITRQLNWFQHPSKQIVDVCIDPLRGTWVLCVCKDASLYLLPALAQLKDPSKIASSSPSWSLTDLSKVSLDRVLKGPPASIVWWHTLDDRNVCILASKIGEIVFVDLALHKEVCRTSIKEVVTRIVLCQDILGRTSFLFIHTDKNGTLQLLLEQPSDSSQLPGQSSLTQAYDMGYDMVAECNTDSILSSDQALKDDIPLGNRIEVLSPEFDFSVHHVQDQVLIAKYDRKFHVLEVYSDLKRIPEFVYQLPQSCHSIALTENIIFAFSEVAGQLYVKLYSRQFAATTFGRIHGNRPDNHNQSELQSFALMEKEKLVGSFKTSFHRPSAWSNHFPHSLKLEEEHLAVLSSFFVITDAGVLECRPRSSPEHYFTDLAVRVDISVAERLGITMDLNVPHLFECVGDRLIKEKDVQGAIKFYNISQCTALKRATYLIEYASVTDGLIFIKQVLKRQPNNLASPERKRLSDMALVCYVEQALEFQAGCSFSRNLEESFRSFINDNFDYDVALAMDLLARHGMIVYLFEVAKARGKILEALEKLADSGLFLLPQPVVNSLLDGGHAKAVCEAYHGAFTYHMEPGDAAKYLLMEPSITKTLVKMLTGFLPKLDVTMLLQVCRVFDPSRPLMKPILEKAFTLRRKRAGSLTSVTSSSTSLTEADADLPSSTELIEMYLKSILYLNSRRPTNLLPDIKHTMRHYISQHSWASSKHVRSSNSQASMDLLPALIRTPIASGPNHIAYVTGESDLYTWGIAKQGRLGHGDIIEERGTSIPLRVEGLHMLGIQVLSVACGAVHTVALCREGVYSWGANQFGQLGVGDTRRRSRPVNVSELTAKQVMSVVCGHYHTLAITSDGRVWAWGWAIHGQLGLSSVENVHVPQQIALLKEKLIIQVAAGHSHTAVLTSKGEVYTFGAGLYGQLGIGCNTKRTTPRHVRSLVYDSIYLIACGAFETLAVSEEQIIFIWGRNYKQFNICGRADSAQFGRQLASKAVDISHRYLPEDLPFRIQNQTISQIACGNWHYMALTSSGFLYTWGCNECGQLGHYNTVEQPQPRNVRALSRKSIAHIAAGSEFSLAVDTEGQLLAWGKADNGQLGLETTTATPQARRSNLSILAPTLVPNLPLPFDRASVGSATGLSRRETVFDHDLTLPELASIGQSSVPYGVESVVVSLSKLVDWYQPAVIERLALHLEQWFVLSFCYELQERWDKAFAYRVKCAEMQFKVADVDASSSLRGQFTETVVTLVGDMLNTFDDQLVEELEEKSSVVQIVSCLVQILAYWEQRSLPYSALEDLFKKHMETLTPLYALVFFGFLNEGRPHESITLRFALRRVMHRPSGAAQFSDAFFNLLASQILKHMESGSTWYNFLSPNQVSPEESVTESIVNAPIAETAMSVDDMLKEVVEHKRKLLATKPFISLSNATVITFAAASNARNNDAPAREQSLLSDASQKADLTVFSCAHNLLYYYMLETVLPEFEMRMAELPEPLPLTAEVIMRFYKQAGRVIPASCPCCVYNNLRQEQLQFLRDTGADVTQNRSSVWEL